MGLFNWMQGFFGHNITGLDDTSGTSKSGCSINPATGLPMISNDCSGVDVAGNPYGTDMNDSLGFNDTTSLFSSDDTFSSSSSSDDWSSSSSSDSWGGSSGFGDW